MTTTHGGYTLALANNSTYYDDVLNGPPGAVWSGPRQFDWFAKVNREMDGFSEPEADRRLRESAVRLAMARPRRLRAGVTRASGPILGRRTRSSGLPTLAPHRVGGLDGPALDRGWSRA